MFLVICVSVALFFGLGHVGPSPSVATFGQALLSMMRLTLGY